MEIIKFIEQKKNFYNSLLKIIENDEETGLDDDYKVFFDNLDNLIVLDEFKEALGLISKISESHYLSPNFISKIEKFFLHISEKNQTILYHQFHKSRISKVSFINPIYAI